MTISTKLQSPTKPQIANRTTAFVAVFTFLLVTLAGAASAAQVKWRVATSAPYSQVRPAVGPDGTVYAVDVNDNLIAVAADGRVLWRAANAGSKGVDVGADGTVYTGNEEWIRAFYPDGSLKWTYVQDPRAFVLIDVAVGPDGHIYAVASNGMGVLSLEDGGPNNPILRWKTPEAYTRTFVGYAEIAFGLSTTPGCIQQLYFYANSHTRAVCLEDGSSIFTTGGGNTRPKVSPVDNTWHRGDSAYSPDGVLQWRAELPLFSSFSEPSLAGDGTHYTVVGGNKLYAIDLLGTVQWDTNLNEFVGLPDVDPTKSMVIMPTSFNPSIPLALKAVSATNGRGLWRVEFPADDSGVAQLISSSIAYSANGDTAYVMTYVNGAADKTYLNAVGTDKNGVYPALVTVDPEPGTFHPDPVPVPVDPDPAPADPDPVPADPDPAPADPDPVPADPDPAPADPDPVPADPDPAPADPDPVPADPDPAPADPDPVPADPDPAPADLDPVPADPDPAPANPDPVPADPDPAPADLDPVPADPAPAPANPDPVPADPDPAPVDSDPVPADPGPAPADPFAAIPPPVVVIPNTEVTTPAPVESDPDPVDAGQISANADSVAQASDQNAEETESSRLVAGSFDAAAFAFLASVLAFIRLFEFSLGTRSKRRKKV